MKKGNKFDVKYECLINPVHHAKIDQEIIQNLLRETLIPAESIKRIKSNYSGVKYTNPLVEGGIGFFLFAYEAEQKYRKHERRDEYDSANHYLQKPTTIHFLLREYDSDKLTFDKSLSELKDFLPEYTHVHENVSHKNNASNLTLYKIGTTSFILKLSIPNGHHYAIKIIKYRYRDNQNITLHNLEYQRSYSAVGKLFTATAYSSRKYFIIMDFIEGKTLREHIDGDLRLSANKSAKSSPSHSQKKLNAESLHQKIKECTRIITELCDVLQDCRQKNIYHMDLSSENIIMREEREDKLEPVLIDFGVNYLLLERVGSAYAFSQQQCTIADELKENPDIKSIKPDIYSLGIILLDMLSEKELDAQTISECLDEVWDNYPDFAIIIEDMIDRDPKNRLIEVSNEFEMFANLKKRLNSAMNLPLDIYLKNEGGAFKKIVKALKIDAFGPTDKLKELWKLLNHFLKEAEKSIINTDKKTMSSKLVDRLKLLSYFPKYLVKGESVEGISIEVARTLYFLIFVLLTELSHYVALFLFACFVFVDVNVLSGMEIIPQLKLFINDYILSIVGLTFDYILSKIGVPFSTPEPSEANIPGRIVGASFSIVATAYYLRIFSAISCRSLSVKTNFLKNSLRAIRADSFRLKAKKINETICDCFVNQLLPKFTELFLRLNSFFFVFPILYAVVIDPKAWPYCTTIGVSCVALNNLFCYYLAKYSSRMIEDKLRLPLLSGVKKDLESFKVWWKGLATYAAATLVLGWLLQNNIAQDEKIYAVTVAVLLNLGFLLLDACFRQGPGMRTMLNRLFSGLRRVRLVREIKLRRRLQRSQ